MTTTKTTTEKAPATKATKGSAPAVHQHLAQVLKSLKVDKNGVLPGNMGGKSYITAVDAAAAVKALFVDHGLTFLSNERLEKHEPLIHKERIVILTVVSGTYTITSLEDGSSVTISGVGDGLATGTAVSSNIASTNALKNALLRTLLITEQSVEDEAKNGVSTAPSATEKKIAAARQPRPAQNISAGDREAQTKVRTEWIETGKLSKDEANERVAAIKNAGSKTPFADLLKSLEAGK